MYLTHCTVLNTRPAGQAKSLSIALEKEGSSVIDFPAIDIVASATDEVRKLVTNNLSDYDLAVFVSPNAAWHGISLVREKGEWPTNLKIAVVGTGTAAAIEELGLFVYLQPESGVGAGALLARLHKETVCVQRIIIFRGRGGLPTLGDALSARGALVTYAEVYAREMPHNVPVGLNERGKKGEIDIIVVTSAQALHHLFNLLGNDGKTWLRNTPFLFVSERIARIALDFRLRHRPLVARGSSDRDIVETLIRWREANN